MAAPGIQFPSELEEKIFEIAVARFPESIPHILLIARRFHEWFKHELYRIIRVDSTRPAARPPFLYDETVSAKRYGRVVDTKRLATYGHWVQHCLLQDCHVTNLLDILKHCQNIEDIALCSIRSDGLGDEAAYLPFLEGLSRCKNLKKLTLMPSDFFYVPIIPFAHPAFSNITHLEILNFITYSWQLWSGLAEMPRLTHLVMTVDPSLLSNMVLSVLIQCRSLKLLILISEDLDPRLKEAWSNPVLYKLKFSDLGPTAGWILDSRIVMLSASDNIPLWNDPMGLWEIGARGGSDSWTIAEEIKAERAKFTNNKTLFDLLQ